jgi:monovalent cation:H+ antiporter-2, CPA2 family
MEIKLLNDVFIIFASAVAVLLLCYRLKIPSIVGFLLTGLFIGPHGLGLVGTAHEVEVMAEMGVVLLLFTIGVEFSLKELLRIKRQILIGGFLQVLLTVAALFWIGPFLGLSRANAIFVGFLISLSSTAIVLKVLQEKAAIESPHGRLALAVLIFQDIAIVPMMLSTPLLAGEVGDPVRSLLMLAGKGIAIISLAVVGGKWLVPWLLLQVTRTRSRELFLLSVLAICLAVTWLTASAGLSLALGAFLAGLIISKSEYSHQALGNVLPFRDVFTSFFFISIGMLLDVRFLLQEPVFILLSLVAVLLIKTLIIILISLVLGYPLRTAIIAGVSLAQVGEFSFVLSVVGLEHGLLNDYSYQLFLAISVLTMLKTPWLIAVAPRLANAVEAWPWPRFLKDGFFASSLRMESDKIPLKDHLIITGFGVKGRNVARAARAAAIPYVVIEMNPETVSLERDRGESIFYGDASQTAVLEHAGIYKARVLVSTVPDPAANRCTIVTARELNPGLHIVARTRFDQEMGALYDLGANEVIPEEFETSVEIFTRVLIKYLVPRDKIEKYIAGIRADGYGMFRQLEDGLPPFSALESHLHEMEISILNVEEGAPLAGRTLAEVQLRKHHGVTLLVAYRGALQISNPHGDFQICAGDRLIAIGSPICLPEVAALARQQPDGH